MKVKTSELTGRALDWAVAIACGWESDRPEDGQLKRQSDLNPSGYTYIVAGNDQSVEERYRYSPSTDWSQCGELIKRFKVSLNYNEHMPRSAFCITAWLMSEDPQKGADKYHGLTPQVAICRAVVAAKLGELVDIPEGIL